MPVLTFRPPHPLQPRALQRQDPPFLHQQRGQALGPAPLQREGRGESNRGGNSRSGHTRHRMGNAALPYKRFTQIICRNASRGNFF